MNTHEAFLREAVADARESVAAGGGPFGALIVKDGEIVARGTNRVTKDNDPTAHAEVEAIRAACAALNTFSLEGCVVYASAEPCPMCFGALYWARPDAVYFAASKEVAARVGFDDAFIYEQLALPRESQAIPFTHVPLPESTQPFTAWELLETRVEY